eukprot:6135123-Pyramimonas_sp.AAC.1
MASQPAIPRCGPGPRAPRSPGPRDGAGARGSDAPVKHSELEAIPGAMRDEIASAVQRSSDALTLSITNSTTSALRLFGERQEAKNAQIDGHLRDLDRSVSKRSREHSEMREQLAELGKTPAVCEAAPPIQNIGDIADWARDVDKSVFVVSAKDAITREAVLASVR